MLSSKECYARDYCKAYSTPKCTPNCDFKLVLEALYSLSNIPKRYRYDIPLRPEKQDMQSFLELKNFKENIAVNVANGEWLYIHSSSPGTGKTTFALKMVNEYFRTLLRVGDMSLENKALYLNTNLFLEELRQAYGQDNTTIGPLAKKAYTVDLLILDDIGVERGTPWTQERLYDLINARYNEQKCTIFTSNLSPNELSERLGMRIGSRVRSSKVVELCGGDRR